MWIKAAVTKEKGAPFTIEDVELEPCRADEILVKIRAVGICHTDEAARMQQLPVPLPAVLGHEGAGVVEASGASVTEFRPGDHVILSYASCGNCVPCVAGKPYACENMVGLNFMGVMPDGTRRHTWNGHKLSSFFSQSSFATRTVVKARNAIKIDQDLGFELAAPLGCGVQTGAGIVLNNLKPEFGSSLAVFGCGTVGMSAIMAARIAGCHRIVAVGGNTRSLELALELGATHIINRKETPNIAEKLRELTGRGLDYAIDTSGVTGMIETALSSLNYMGTLVLAGAGSLLTLSTNLGAKTVKGVSEGDSVPKDFIPKLLSYYREGRFPVDRLIQVFDFEEINAAFAASHHGEVIKAVLRLPEE
ncbi:MAG: NAD(P)-dependent alcohol dehydrogenase [Lawsonibacter sp.]